MTSWVTVELKELVDSDRGISYGIVQPGKHVSGGVPIVRVSDVRHGRINTEQPLCVAREVETKYSRTRLKGGELLITVVGTIGETAVAPPDLYGWNVARAIAVVPVRPEIGAYWCKLALCAPAARDMMRSQLNTTVQPTLNLAVVSKLPILLPSEEERARITSVFRAYDDLIEVNRRRIALLEEMAGRLFEEWFVRFRFPGQEGHTVNRTSAGALPDGWRQGMLGDVVEQRRDKTSPGGHLSGRAYVPIDCIGHKTLGLSDAKPWQDAQSSLQLFERGDILFGAMRPYFHKVCPAPVAGITRSTCFVLRPRKASLFAFATLGLFRDETVAFATAHSTGSTIPYATWGGSLERMPLAIPSDELAARFDDLVRPMIELIMSLCKSNNILATARDLLLPRFISGQLSVCAAECELEAAE